MASSGTKEVHYIVGYGSLMSEESRAATGITGLGWPVKIDGYRVGWSNVYSATTYLGAERCEGKSSNAVIFKLASDEIKRFDTREGRKYERKLVDLGQISCWWKDQKMNPSKQTNSCPEFLTNPTDGKETQVPVWIYCMRQWQNRRKESFVLQSYVDVVVSGALAYGEEFAKCWIQNCEQWKGDMLEDRVVPMYPRALSKLPSDLAKSIDELLPSEYSECRSKVDVSKDDG
eukprot:CAMPEP_0114514066 /NCGR_PEP_ID=MMETSP0109-20121206/15940_1 /TAXON_ID=29199 /ORGANISM="Chlorarachnion reptans, Strain CCCM449" /LENGTH=230 /DNA_ID=CAMNT_0001694051 /DNA_START=112 /DNA_END=807 /DNA_ORIENTATION=-